MAMERIARRCKDPKSKDLQRLQVACFHHEGLADMRPGFNRVPGTMVRRCGGLQDSAERNIALLSAALGSWDLHLSDAQLITLPALEARKRSDRIWDARCLSLQSVPLR